MKVQLLMEFDLKQWDPDTAQLYDPGPSLGDSLLQEAKALMKRDIGDAFFINFGMEIVLNNLTFKEVKE